MITITCPKCGETIDVDEALVNHIKSEVNREYQMKLKNAKGQWEKDAQEKIKKEVEDAVNKERNRLDTERLQLQENLKASEETMDQLAEKLTSQMKEIAELRQKDQTRDLEVQAKVAAAREEAFIEAKQKADEAHKLKYRELEKKLERTQDALNEANTKAQQGSQQIQGDVFEEKIHECLTEVFSDDEISRVSKGIAGPDVIQKVKRYGVEYGTIAWEVKNAKWNKQWIAKLKGDVSIESADVGILVSTYVPKEIETFGEIDGIIVTRPFCAIALATLIREHIIDVKKLINSAKGKDERMNLLYEYITSPDFRSRVTAIVQSFENMRNILAAEKKATLKRWKKQEMTINLLISNTAGMYGEFQGILGKAVEDIPLLEEGDVTLE